VLPAAQLRCAARSCSSRAQKRRGSARRARIPHGRPDFSVVRQCPRRLGKNPGYTTSPRSAIPADGEASTGGRTADPPARHRGPRAAACAARARRSAPQKWLTRWLYGYDRERFDDATTLNDTTRNDAMHDTLPTPTTTHAPKRST